MSSAPNRPLTEKILHHLNSLPTEGSIETLELANLFQEDHQKVIGAIKSLETVPDLILTEQKTCTKWELTLEGQLVVKNGSHEAVVFLAVPPGTDGIPQPELMKITGPDGKIGMSKAIQSKWLKTVKVDGITKIVRNVDSIVDNVQKQLELLSLDGINANIDQATINEYKKRKLMQQVSFSYYLVKKGSQFTTTIEKQETDLTADLLASGDWKTKKFKPYNFNALGSNLHPGHLHPLLKVRSEFRQIFLEMGFSEMPTNRFVESCFWNFDVLFVPQQHPARDAQDTFFVSRPQNCNSLPQECLEKVKKVHSTGDYGSIGYRYNWSLDEAKKNVLRTHTTAISARMLYEIAKKKSFEPVKLFSIDRVFRNETLDATHLAEFHQVEGVIAGKNITLGNLLGIMKVFFGRLGVDKLRFKPAYNPYTEPSMEVFAFHPGLKKWVEIGNSGLFRPELLRPLGIPPDVRCIGYGLSLERPTMIRYGIDNIRDLVGPKVDLQMVYNNPICRLDKI